MKRSLIILAVLVLLAVGTISAIAGGLWSVREDIQMTETVRYGQRDAVLGLTVTRRAEVGNRLFWDTTFTLELGGLAGETDYAFSPTRRVENGPNRDMVELGCKTNFGMSGGISLEEDHARDYPTRSLIDVAGRTPAGQTREETVVLADYYDHYPLSLDVYGARLRSRWYETTWTHLPDYFQIPVPRDHRIRVSVTKDEGGSITEVECRDVEGGLALFSCGVILEDTMYLVLSETPIYSDTPPTPLPSQLLGIHKIDMSVPNELHGEDLQGMERVLPMIPADGQVLDLQSSGDGGELRMLTRGADGVTLWVIDAADMAVKQTLLLPAPGEDLWLNDMQEYGDFLAVRLSDGTVYILTRTGRDYAIALTADLFACPGMERTLLENVFAGTVTMDYDGGRLAVLASMDGSWRLSPMYLMVLDRTGLTYLGEYSGSAPEMAFSMRPVADGTGHTIRLPG